MRAFLANTYRLGVKELWSLWRDPVMMLMIAYVFTLGIYNAAKVQPETLTDAAIAIVDEDQSPLSQRIASAFYPPQFNAPRMIPWSQMDAGMDAGEYIFALVIPHHFQRDVLAGRGPQIQLNADATRMSQAFSGSSYVQQIVQTEITGFTQRHAGAGVPAVDLALRARFNPSLQKAWFGSVVELINDITMLAIMLTGAALIREREHGTVEHLLVMPVTAGQIMLAKVWSMGLVVLLASFCSLTVVIERVLAVPVNGSLVLFFIGATLSLFATTSMGIFLATVARNMPQFGMLMILTILPLQMLSGGQTPRESMPELVQDLMLVAPTTHFVQLGQALLFRGAGLEVVWPQFAALALIGAVLFTLSLRRFRSTIAQMA
jgi:ABC-2 type transport system permease protein